MKAEIKLLLISLILISLGIGLIWMGFFNGSANSLETISPNIVQREKVYVTRVVDGDTVEIEGGQKVRYIGIDTPEVVDLRRLVACFGQESSQENKRMVEGKGVFLVKDISETDKFGRLLRYVFVTGSSGESIFVNDYLVRQGFAKVSTFPPDVKFSEQFLQAEREAKENNRGLWQKCP